MQKLSFASIIFLFTALGVKAQSERDGLRYSMTQANTTARSAAMGSAFGALGADFSSLSINAAGIGLYRKSEFMFSPSMEYKVSTGHYLNNSDLETKLGIGIGNIGLIASAKLRNPEKHGWEALNFGIGYNNIGTFNSRSSFAGHNEANSYLDYILQHVNAGAGSVPNSFDPFSEDLAYKAYLINPVDSLDSLHYLSEIPNAGILQSRTSNSHGSMGEVLFSFGSNYKDKLFLGATLGIVTLTYTENTIYRETDDADTIARFKEFSFNNYLKTEGLGFNLKLGVIYKPTDWLRMGVGVQTPTIMSLTDNYTATMSSKFDDGSTFENDAKGNFDYQFSTPVKATGSLAIIFGKVGCLSADYEVLNYSEMNFSSSQESFVDLNQGIQNTYTGRGNLRIGGEIRIQNVAIRGGYAFTASPFRSGVGVGNADFSKTAYSGGFGIRDEKYFLDFAYSYSTSKEFYRPYSLSTEEVQGARTTFDAHKINITVGVKF